MRHILRYLLAIVIMSFALSSLAQTTKWRDMYKVKKKDTIFGIAKKYDISIPDLMDANPEMKKEGYELKKGDFVFIPFDKNDATAKVGNAANINNRVNNGFTLENADIRKRSIRIGVMLPIHDNDGDGRRMTEYYRGILIACDSLKSKGISTDIHTWNVPIDADIRQTLLDSNAKRCDIIFGPLYSTQVWALGNFCKQNGIKMVIPFSISSDEVLRNSQVFQVYQTPEELNTASINAFLSRFSNHHAVFVDCNDSTSRKGMFTFGLRQELEKRGMAYSITNLSSSEMSFYKAFSKSQPNVVILNTGRSPELNVAMAKLNGLTANYPGVVVSLFGYTEWLMYTKYNLENFFKFDTYIPTVSYYNPLSVPVQRMENNYARWFHSPMMLAIPRFAITGYDQAMFFLSGLNKYGKSFDGTQSTYKPLQTQLKFKRLSNGGMQNRSFMLIHYTYDHTIESINY